MKNINLDEILKTVEIRKPFKWRNLILAAMREACNQTIDLCADEAEISWGSEVTKSAYQNDLWVDEESILRCKEAIK